MLPGPLGLDPLWTPLYSGRFHDRSPRKRLWVLPLVGTLIPKSGVSVTSQSLCFLQLCPKAGALCRAHRVDGMSSTS